MSGFGWSGGNSQTPQFPYQPNAPIPPLPQYQQPPQYVPHGFVQSPSTLYNPNEPVARPINYSTSFSAPPTAGGSESGPPVPEFYWVTSSVKQHIPENAVEGGMDVDGTTIYVGMAQHNGEEFAAKIIPQKTAAYISYGGSEVFVNNYKVLCQHRLKWIPFDGKVPSNAVPAGRSKEGEVLYIGRSKIEGSVTVGKVHPSHNCCYIPFGGKEHRFSNFEILVRS